MTTLDLIVRRTPALSRPESVNAGARTIDAVVATSRPVPMRDAAGPFLEILDPRGADLGVLIGAQVLDSHRQSSLADVLGVVVAARVEGDGIVATLQIGERAGPVWDDIATGALRNLSVGYSVAEYRESKDAKGRRIKTATAWTPREVSFVPVPADPGARTRQHARHTMETEIETTDAPAMNRAATNQAIRAIAATAGLSRAWADDLIDRDASEDAARAAAFEAMKARPAQVRTIGAASPTMDDPVTRRAAMAEGLHARMRPGANPSDAARQYAGMSCAELARECLRAAGHPVTGLAGEDLITRASHTTSDFPLILGDAVGRELRAAYQAVPSALKAAGRRTTANDFRQRHRLQLSADMKLERVGEGGEYKFGTMNEARETYRLDTFGKIFRITRQAMVNDDVGAFADAATRLGRAASAFEATLIRDLIEANSGAGPTMSDGNPLFHVASHANRAATAAVLSETTLAAARLAMRKQTDQAAELVTVGPRFLIVPSDLETAAEKLISTVQATRTADANPFAGLQLLVEPRLTSATRFYLAADPGQVDGLEYCYLAGAEGPQIETQIDFNTDAFNIKVRLDFAAGFVDWRSWFMNPGA